MNSLQISGNKPPQSSGNAANAPQTDSQAADAQPDDPFALLLARQIGGADLSALTAGQAAIAMDGNAAADSSTEDPTSKDAQDPANTLASILLQLPASEGQMADGRRGFGGFSQESGYKRQMANLEGNQIIQLSPASLPSETAQSAELSPGLPQSGANAAQTIAPPAMPASMPGMLANNMPQTNAPQTIATPLGHNGWADEFSQKISWISTQQNQVAELHLNPPNLGPLDVVLKISDNQATALFASPHGAVRDAVENALPKLREILADNGIMLGNTTISDQPPHNRSNDEFMNQNFGAAAQREVSDTAPESVRLSPAAAQTAPARRHNGMVDTFA